MYNLKDGYSKLNKSGMRTVYSGFYLVIIIILLLLISSWKIDWLLAWYYAFYMSIVYAVSNLILIKHNPELLNKRGEVIQEGTKKFDKIFFIFYRLLSVVLFITAGLDSGKHGSHFGIAAIILGYVIHTASTWLATIAMLENTHFETTVRIQNDRHHTVITTGPYKFVRHPGYLSSIIIGFAIPLVLGSVWALIPALLMDLTFVIRTYLEDKTLQKELPGYKEYSTVTKFRLFPGVW